LVELSLESVLKTFSDVGNDVSELRASGNESRDKLLGAGWEFAKEEINS
jgi:hypothetical protein